MLQGKVWGTTEALLVTPLIEVHRIKINPNSYCSTHKHSFKYNAFYCLDGLMHIEVYKNDYALMDTTCIRTNEIATVPPGEYHRFVTKDYHAWALEIYYLNPIDINDIVRKDCGGKNIGDTVTVQDSFLDRVI